MYVIASMGMKFITLSEVMLRNEALKLV